MHVLRPTRNLLQRAWLICGLTALLLAIAGLFVLSPTSSAQAATVQTTATQSATSALPAQSDVAIVNVRRIARDRVEVDFVARQRYDSFALRYSVGGGGWRFIRVGRVTRVIIIIIRAPRRHFVFEACGAHSGRYGNWSNPYNWMDS